jgi:hypothetical protein
MQQAIVKVFDEYLSDTTPSGGTYLVTTSTSLEHTELLSSADQIGLQAVVHVLSSAGNLPLTIAIEHSANGRTWKRKNVSAEINAALDISTGTRAYVGGEGFPARASQRFVRLRIDVGDGHTPFSVRLVIEASTRTRTKRLPPTAQVPSPPQPLKFARVMAVLGLRQEAILELERLARSADHSSSAERSAFILQSLSGPSKAELWRFVRELRSLDPRSKQLLINAASGLVKLLSSPSSPPGVGPEEHARY